MRPLIDSLTEYLSLKLGQHNVKLGKQFIKFCVVGVTNLAIYLVVYWIMTRLFFWHYLSASIGGFIIAVTWSFFINRKWTFRHDGKDHGRQYLTFVAANLIGMAVNLVLLSLFIEVFKMYDIAAQFVCSVIVAFINFSLNRFWTFRNH